MGFEDYDDDVEEVEVDKTPKRKVHGRTPTAFVPKKAASPDARDPVAAEWGGEFVAAWQHGSLALPKVDFDDDAEDILVEEDPSSSEMDHVFGQWEMLKAA